MQLTQPQPPENHQFNIETDNTSTIVSWKRAPFDPMRYVIGLYYLGFGFMLVGIFVTNIVQGQENWEYSLTVGGFAFSFCLFLAALFLKWNRSERITLSENALTYDPGAAPLSIVNFHWLGKKRYSFNPIPYLFKKRPIYHFDKAACPELILEGFGDQQRLRFDLGADRIVIGEYLKEPEREWLFQVIRTWMPVDSHRGH